MIPSPRFRKTDQLVPSKYVTTDYNSSGTQQSTSTTISGRMKSGSLKSILDYPEPGFIRRVKAGEVILHPVTINREARECTESSWSFGPHPVWGRRTIVGSMAAEFHQPCTGEAAFRDKLADWKGLALIEAYAKMNSPDELSSVFYAERGKTLTMIRRPLAGTRDLVEKIFKRKMRYIRLGWTVARATAQAWLEFRFGWRPLMSDIAGIAKAAGHAKPLTGTLLTKRGGVDREFAEIFATHIAPVPGFSTMDVTTNWQLLANIRAGVLYTYRDITEAEWKAKCFGLNLNTVPSHIWELVPYSFVVDYFWKVGLWLAAITPDPDITVHGNWVSTKLNRFGQTSADTATIFINGLGPPFSYTQGGGSYSEELEEFTREIGLSLPSVPPMAGKPLSFSQNLDIAALLLNLVNKNLGQLRL